MIGIIGYGMVGKAVEYGFSNCKVLISDPKYNNKTASDICKMNPEAVFVCVPTPTDDSNYKLIIDILREIRSSKYEGVVVVKSTIFPKYIKDFDVVYNPEFLSRKTSKDDFVNPPMLILGGNRSKELLEIYKKYSKVSTDKVFITDIETAAFTKYTMNSFYATKITFMNSMHEVAKEMNANFEESTKMLSQHPWMGTHHFQVPGPDGEFGFGGPCLPKDTEALVKEYGVDLLYNVIELNKRNRNGS